MIKLLVGLGNPGRQYEKTRHNAGFWFLDGLHNGAWVKESKFNGELSEFIMDGQKIILLKPMAYMNRSGLAVGSVLRYFKVSPEELLVIHDDLDLSAGDVRLKIDGGHAGHNGLRDIIACIGARNFARLRIGIGRPTQGAKVADYVLSEPRREERMAIDAGYNKFLDSISSIIKGDFARAMNELHS